MADKTLGIQVQMSIDDVLSGLSDLINKFTEIPDSITTDIQLGEDPTANVDNLKDELDDLNDTTTTTDIEVAGDTSGATDVKDALDELDGDTVSANVDVDNSDAVTGIDEVESGLDEIDGTTVSADVETTGTDEVTSSASDATTAITALASAVAVADAEATRMGSERSLQKALSYEGVSVTATNVSELRSELSKVQGAIPTDQASEGLYILAKGLKNASMVSAELPPAFKLIKTTGTDTSEAMYDLSSIITAYGLSTSEATSTTTYLTNAINDMSSNAGDPSTILSTVTALIPALKSVGYTANDIVDYIGAFGDSGISATVAASALTTGAKTLSKQLTEAKYSGSDAEGVLKTMGISAKDASGNFRSVSDIMSDVLDKSSSMSDSQFEAQYGMTKLAAMQLLFGSRAAQTMSQLNESADTYGAKVTATGDKTTASMTKINTNTMTLQTQFQKLWNTITNAPALPTWLFEGAAITVGFVVLVKGLQLVGSALKTTYEFLGKVKSTTENLGSKAKDIWHAVFGSDEMSAELQTVETETGKYEVVESRIANTIRKFKADAASLKDTRLFGDLFGEEGKLNTGALDSSYTKFSDFVGKIKIKAGELKESNVWKILFGDEKGNLNFNIIDKVESKIISFVNTVKPKIEELNGILKAPFEETKNISAWQNLMKQAEDSSRGYTQINPGNQIAGWEDNKVVNPDEGVFSKWADWTKEVSTGIGEVKDGFKGAFDNYVALQDAERSGKGFTLIDDTYKTSLKEISDDTTSFFDDEKGRINLNLNDITSRVSSFVDNIKTELSGLKGILTAPFEDTANILRWQDLMKIAEDSGKGYTQVNPGNQISGWEDNKVVNPDEGIFSRWANWTHEVSTGAKEVQDGFKGAFDNYVALEDAMRSGRGFTQITDEMYKVTDSLNEGDRSLNSFFDDEEGRIKGIDFSGIEDKQSSLKGKITSFKEDLKSIDLWGSLLSDAESSGKEFSYITEDFKITNYPYLTTIAGKEDEELSSTIKSIADKTNALKEIGTDFGREYGSVIDKTVNIIDEGYSDIQKAITKESDGIKYSEGWTDIEPEMKAFNDSYKKSLDELKGIDIGKLTIEIQDELESAWADIVRWDTRGEAPILNSEQDSAFEERLVDFFEEKGFNAEWESSGKNCTIKISKGVHVIGEVDYVDFEVDFDKLQEILSITTEKTNSFLDDEEGRIKGINFDGLINKISSVKDKAIDALKYLDELTTYHFNAPGIEDAQNAGRDFSFIDPTNGKIIENTYAAELDNWMPIIEKYDKQIYDKFLADGKVLGDIGREYGKTVEYVFGGEIEDIKKGLDSLDRVAKVTIEDIKSSRARSSDGIKYSENWTSIESEMKAFNDTYKNSLKEISDDTTKFFGDEKGRVNIKGFGSNLIDNIKAGIDEKLPILDAEGTSISDRILTGIKAKLPDFKTEGQQIIESINEGIKSIKIEIPTTGQTGTTWNMPYGSSTGSTEGAYKLPDGNEILPPESKTETGKENVGWLGDSNGLGGIVDKLKTWKLIPKFNAASLGRGVLSVLGDAEMLPMMVGTTLAEMNPVKHNLTPEEQAEVDKRNQKSIQEENDRPSFQQQVGAIGNALFPKTSSDAIVKPYQNAINKVKNIKLPSLPSLKLPSLSSIESGVGSTLGGLGTYIKNHMPKMPTLGTIKLPSLGSIESGIGSTLGGLKTYITSHLPKIPNLSWGNLSKGFWDTVGWVESEYNGLKDWVTSHEPKIPTLSWPNLTSGAAKVVKDIGDAVNTILADINKLPGVSTLTSGAQSWGSSITSAIGSGIDKGKASVQNGLNTISSWFPHSPPKAGPLATVTESNMESWAAGIVGAGAKGLSNFTFDKAFSLPKIPSIPSVFSSGSGSQGNTFIVQAGAVVIEGNATKDTVENAGSYLMDGMAGRLDQQANNRGYSVTNVIR